MPIEKRVSLARIISNIINPFLVSLVVLTLLSIQATSGASGAVKWSLISVAVSVFPVFAVVLYLVHNRKLDGIFVSSRRQRHSIYLLAIIFGIIGCVVHFYFKAPAVIFATFVSGLTAIVVFTLINFWWKISLHTAFIAGSVAILTISFGAIGAVSVVLLPPAGWARIELGLHSPAQVAAGAVLAAAIAIAVFYLFGLL